MKTIARHATTWRSWLRRSWLRSTLATGAFLSMALLYSACSKDTAPSTQKLATEVAQESYEALYNGKYEDFLKARANYDEMPQSYRDALTTSYRQHVAEVRKNHEGVTSVEAIRTENDTALGVMQVFMTVTYGDQSQEEIVVPLVKVDDEWKLK